jgi:hypothetical protein
MMPWHSVTFEDMVREGVGADRAPVAEILVGSMRSGRSMESMAFHHAGKSSAFAQTCHIDDITGFEETESDLTSQINPFDGFHGKLSQKLKRAYSRFLEMAP